jgi:phosphatidylinositol alpha-mannosyltransferase
MAVAATDHAARYAWPRVADEVMGAYRDAIAMPAPESTLARATARLGIRSADGVGRRPPERLPSLEPDERSRREKVLAAARRAGVALALLGGGGLGLLALHRIGLTKIATSLLTSRPHWVVVGLALMCAAMVFRGFAWHAILKAALPRRRVRRRDAMQGTFIGVLMSATLPARLGEPSRSLVVARRIGRPRETLPVVLGTIVSQTLLNLVALAILGTIMFSTAHIFSGHTGALAAVAIAPLAALAAVVLAPLLLRGRSGRSARLSQLRSLLTRVRTGLRVFREPRLALAATAGQLAAWALQCVSCYTLLVALGLDHRAGVAAAAGVLFAVNVTAVLPAAPSNLGVFQAACVAVLTGAYHVSTADALAYGIILQAVEIATAVLMGIPALVGEGLSWREVRLRAIHSAPVKLSARPRRALVGAAEG